MTLNPFEQLEFFVPDPKRAFTEIIEILLQDKFITGLVQTDPAGGGVHLTDLGTGSPEGATLYQPKYFAKRWRNSQRQQIRDVFQPLLQEQRSRPSRWVLCVPTVVAPEDLRWFDTWRKSQPVTIELLDGNDLLKMLEAPAGRRAMEKMRLWGVTVPGAESACVYGCLRVRAADPKSGLSHYLYVSLYNSGIYPAKGLRVELAHSSTRYFSLRQDEREWSDESKGRSNPRFLRGCRPLLPKEDRIVAVIPIGAHTPLPLCIRLKFSTQETPPIEQHLCLEKSMLASAHRFDFGAGPGPELILAEPLSAPAIAA